MPLIAVHQTAVDLIMEFEGLELKAYPDPATGGEPWTIGYGHTTRAGPPAVGPGLRITKEEAEAILKRDLEKFSDGVFKMLRMPVNAYQFGALVSLAYNIGLGNFRKSSLLTAVNAGDFKTAAAKFALYNRANKKVMAGLTRRRAAEAALFLRPLPGTQDAPKPSVAPAAPPKPVPATADAPKPRNFGLIATVIIGLGMIAAGAWNAVVEITGYVSPWW